MEIVFVIVLVIIAILVIGSLDNARPLSSWSDEKLERMAHKYLNAARANSFGTPAATKYLQQAQSVQEEIAKRKSAKAESTISHLAAAMGPMLHEAGQKMAETVEKTIKAEGVDLETARAIVGKRLNDSEQKFLAAGLGQDEAMQAAMKEVLDLSLKQ